MTAWTHAPVMPEETLSLLVTDRAGIYLDCTVGLGGHSEKLLERLDGGGRVVGCDLDPQALKTAGEKLARFGEKRFSLYECSYVSAPEKLAQDGIREIDGAMFDFGLSSLQLDNPAKGFSFRNDGPLDMRFSPATRLTAEEVVNSWPHEQLVRILREYGEERFAPKIAAAIIRRRGQGRITTTRELCDVIERSVPRSGGINPATRTFQALRITVNSELENVEKGLRAVSSIIRPGGRIAALSFHSLEDRIIKNFFRQLSAESGWDIVTRKPAVAADSEVAVNPRSRSAKLRVIERAGLKAGN